VRYRAAPHEVERVLVVGFLIVEGRAVLDQGPRLPERVVNAEPIEQRHVDGQQRFPDVEAWKRLALDDEHGKVLLREQRRGRGATRPSADDEHVTPPPGHRPPPSLPQDPRAPAKPALDHRRGPRRPPPNLPQHRIAPAQPALEAGYCERPPNPPDHGGAWWRWRRPRGVPVSRIGRR